MNTQNEGNTGRFTGKSELYARFRPSYPAGMLDFLYAEAGEVGLSPRSVVADIGAGTGIFSRLLLERGSEVYCVEPNTDMRGQLETAMAAYPRAHIVSAPAEATTLPDGSVDFITAAQAFHWFDRAAFRREARRILRPGGKVILVWNNADREHPFMKAHDAVHDIFCPGYTDRTAAKQESPEEYNDFFAHPCTLHVFENTFETDLQGYVGRALSSSYAPKEGTPEAEGLAAALTKVFEAHSRNGLLLYPNRTSCYIGEV